MQTLERLSQNKVENKQNQTPTPKQTQQELIEQITQPYLYKITLLLRNYYTDKSIININSENKEELSSQLNQYYYGIKENNIKNIFITLLAEVVNKHNDTKDISIEDISGYFNSIPQIKAMNIIRAFRMSLKNDKSIAKTMANLAQLIQDIRESKKTLPKSESSYLPKLES
jgi:hypothetical protein